MPMRRSISVILFYKNVIMSYCILSYGRLVSVVRKAVSFLVIHSLKFLKNLKRCAGLKTKTLL